VRRDLFDIPHRNRIKGLLGTDLTEFHTRRNLINAKEFTSRNLILSPRMGKRGAMRRKGKWKRKENGTYRGEEKTVVEGNFCNPNYNGKRHGNLKTKG